ncbi:hypothetical protein K457DRAFT_19651 [Linnemannia elongata AG-77]|uniref:Uncharacterized protein n=1 Tax=Linnemannia elongata AG-77 TaxID=1314771 RepID=A0A197JX06_9FUNG|nr:hypothetical protein K457DRAFT_19651 [Linnemannia elongata AG-77]
MAMVSNSASRLDTLSKNRISFREDLNDTRHCDNDSDGFSSDDNLSDDDDDETSPSRDPETAEIASMEKKSLKYRKSLTMLNQLHGLKLTGADNGGNGDGANGAKQPTREHLLAAKKSIDDLTAWVNAAALEGDDDPFGDDDD